MAKLSSLFSDVLSQAPNCPKVVAVTEIRKAAIELCERTAVWSRIHDPIYLYKNGAEYDLEDTPPDAVVDRILDARLDGSPFGVVTPRDLFSYVGESGSPQVCSASSPGIVTVAPTPEGRHVLNLRVAFKPDHKADEMDDSVINQWRDAIVNGALFRLKMMSEKPWSDPKAAAIHKTFFEDKVNKAKVKAVAGYGVVRRTVKAREYG